MFSLNATLNDEQDDISSPSNFDGDWLYSTASADEAVTHHECEGL